MRIADVIESHDGRLTRTDLALDFFEGFEGGIDRIKSEFDQGLCNSDGKRLRCSMVGDWSANPQDGRSIYFGSKAAGKQTNAYEKGHQLFGFEAGSKWLRIEVRFGNKLRLLPVDMLRNPAAYFSGASEWHRKALLMAGSEVNPINVKTKKRLAIETVEAEVSRAIRWANNTAGPSLAMLVQHATESQLFEVTENKRLPGRMQKFSVAEIKEAFGSAFDRVSKAGI
jgi:phage replication initiation protein